jgi:subtilisin family serine protease
VAGTIAGYGALSTNKAYHGLAPNVQLVVLKVLDGTGAGYTSDVVRAIDFAVANKSKFGIDVINLSLGHPIYEPASTDPLVQAVERASKAGIVVLAAAGNNGINPTTGSPDTRHQLAGQRAVGHHGGRRVHEQHRDAARTTASRTTARRARPGTTRS